MEQEFQISNNGSVEGTWPRQRRSNIGLILEKMEDTTTPVAEVSRLITLEITMALKEQISLGCDPTAPALRKNLNEEIKNLRELQKSITETEVLSKKDVLNLEGAKFQYVFGEVVNQFKKSLAKAGVEPTLGHSVMKHFSDIVRTEEEKIRRELAKIDTSK